MPRCRRTDRIRSHQEALTIIRETTVAPGTTEGSDSASETCCCKSNPVGADDGKPVYDNGNRMECSSKQGECVPDVQCQQTQQPE